MKRKQITENISAALKSGDTTRQIIGRDAYAPKNGNGTAAKKTLTALVKEAEASAALARENMLSSNSNANNAADSSHRAIQARYRAEHAARTAKWCAAIAAASAIISIITAAITDLANNVEFQGWWIKETQSVGPKIDPNLPLASLEKETHHGYAGQTELEYNKEGIDLYADGTIAAINEEINSDGEYAEYSSLTLSQLRVLLIAAERIAAASAESELTQNLIKSAENEKHL